MAPSFESIVRQVQNLLPQHVAEFHKRLRDWVAEKKAEQPALMNSPADGNREELPESADSSPALPMNPPRLYQYALLAAINDSWDKSDSTIIRLDPWWNLPLEPNDRIAASGAALMFHLRSRVAELKEAAVPHLLQMVELVKQDLSEHCETAAAEPDRVLHRQEVGSDGKSSRLDTMLDDAMMACMDIAKQLGLSPDPLRKKLDRWRGQNDSGWREVNDRSRGQAKYLYQIGAIRHLLRDAISSTVASA